MNLQKLETLVRKILKAIDDSIDLLTKSVDDNRS